MPAPPSHTYGSYLEFFSASEMARFRHSARVGGRWPVRILKIDQGPHEDLDPPTNELIIGLVLGGRAPARWSWSGGKWNRTSARLPGEIGVTPVGASGFFQVDGSSQMLVICLPLHGLHQSLGADVSLHFGELHDRYQRIPEAMVHCHRMWRAAAYPSPVSDDVIEDASIALLSALRPSDAADTNAKRQRFTAKNITTIEDTIAMFGPGRATVHDLALALDLPIKVFRRLSRNTFGKRPHALLLERRIQAGCEVLQDRQRTLAEIALDLGFASQSHFNMAFTRHIGISPARFRKFIIE